jgi:hypothetical protein
MYVALLLGLLVSGCSGPAPSADASTARSTVSAYFAAVDGHRWTASTALLSPSLRRTYGSGPDSDRRNTLSVTDVHVTVRPAPFARGDYPGFTDVHQAFVTYDATYRVVYGSTDGPQARFVHVGRQGADGPWRIVEIGTGP